MSDRNDGMNEWYEAEQRIERAQQLCESHHFAEALEEIEAAIAINPNNAAWHAQCGLLLDELGRHTEAVAAYSRSLEIEPDDRDVTMAMGVAQANLGRLASACELFESVSKRFADFEPAYCQRIRVYTELGRHDQAEETFYLAQQLDDQCPDCFYHLGASLIMRGQVERAIYCWNRVLELDPVYVGVNRRIAHAYRATQRHADAHEYLLAELRQDPGNTDLLFDLGELALEMGQTAKAAAKFAHILELDPSHAQAHTELGRICLRRGDAVHAMARFEAAREIDAELRTDPEFAISVAEALFQLRRLDEARDALNAILEREPNFAPAQRLLGRCLLAQGKPAEAADCFRKRLAVDDADLASRFRLGVCMEHLHRPDAAFTQFGIVLDARPDSVPVLHHSVVCAVELGRWNDARKLIARALSHDPAHAALTKLSRELSRIRLKRAVHSLVNTVRRAIRS